MHCSQLNTSTFYLNLKPEKAGECTREHPKPKSFQGPADKGTMLRIMRSLALLGQLVYAQKGQGYPVSHTP